MVKWQKRKHFYLMVKISWFYLIRLVTIPACDRQTDRRNCYGNRALHSYKLERSKYAAKQSVFDWFCLYVGVIAGRLKLGFTVDQREILTVYGQWNSQYFAATWWHCCIFYSVHLIVNAVMQYSYVMILIFVCSTRTCSRGWLYVFTCRQRSCLCTGIHLICLLIFMILWYYFKKWCKFATVLYCKH